MYYNKNSEKELIAAVKKQRNVVTERMQADIYMEKILAFQVRNIEEITKITSPLHIQVIEVATADLRQKIGTLAGVSKSAEADKFTGTPPEESMLLFCDLTEKHFDKILSVLRQKEIKMDYKAVLTKTNQNWTPLQLYIEVEREKRAMEH